MSNGRSALLAAVLVLFASAARCGTISQAKLSANWMQVTVEGVVTYLEPNECYIESTDRSGGIRVVGPTVGIGLGDSVAAVGTFAVVDGEPAVTGASINRNTNPGEIRPFGMPNRAVGGASKWSPMGICDYVSKKVPAPPSGWVWERNWVPACGANNTGLLVTTWGTVKSTYYSPTTSARWFHIDDGSSLVSDYGDTGVLVYSDAVVESGQFVSVTGVSSTEPSLDASTRLIRVIRARQIGDVRMLRERQIVQYPFSDEFDKPVLDHRWTIATDQQLSLTDRPGWLTASVAATNSSTGGLIQQPLHTDWDLEMKMQVELSQDPRASRQEAGASIFSLSPDPVHLTIYYTPSDGAKVRLGTDLVAPFVGNTCYFRARQRGSAVFASYSLDGTTYSQEYQFSRPSPLIAELDASVGYSSVPVDPPLRAQFDYVRLTSATQ